MKPCIRCLCQKIKRQRAGIGRHYCVIQCYACGFNVSALTFEEAERQWNGFRVWELILDECNDNKRHLKNQDFYVRLPYEKDIF